LNGQKNNAGGQFLAPAANITSNGFRTVVDLNLNGTWNVTKAVYQHSMSENGGAIVNITMDNFNGYGVLLSASVQFLMLVQDIPILFTLEPLGQE
jgi:hypothetical protein